MVINRPENTQRLMPRLAYMDAPAAIEFLCRAFGFEETGRFAPGGKVVYSSATWTTLIATMHKPRPQAQRFSVLRKTSSGAIAPMTLLTARAIAGDSAKSSRTCVFLTRSLSSAAAQSKAFRLHWNRSTVKQYAQCQYRQSLHWLNSQAL